MKPLFVLLLVVIGIGCTSPPDPVYDMPELPQAGHYELAWVEPSIVYADSLMTLIKAQRVDSFYVEKPMISSRSSIVTLAFEVTYQPCYTRIKLINSAGEDVLKIYEGSLSLGHYKVSCNRSKLNQSEAVMRNLFLKADICGTAVIEPLM